MFELPAKMIALSTFRESVAKAFAGEHLKAAATRTNDPEVLLGLAALAQAGSPVRQEIAHMATLVRPGYAPIVAVLAVVLDGVNESSIREVLERDPDNALGYYLEGALLHQSAKEHQALEAFRKAAACSEMRLYESTTAPALFKALDALHLVDRDRLCAGSWMGCRFSNFGASVLQLLRNSVSELEQLNIGTRKEVADLLLVLAAHLFGTNYYNRWLANACLESALFALKAKSAPADSAPTKDDAAVTTARVGAMLRWPGVEALRQDDGTNPWDLARFLADRIHRAFAYEDPSQMNAGIFGERDLDLPGSQSKARLEEARQNVSITAKALIEVALVDCDEILRAYLTGIPPRLAHSGVCEPTLVEKLIKEKPDLFKAAAANEIAMRALWEAGARDPWRSNTSRMMQLVWPILSYATDHNHSFPPTIDALTEKGYLARPVPAVSTITGRPYVYTAAGEKLPARASDRGRFVLLYDDEPVHGVCYQCIFAWGGGGKLPIAEVKEQLRKRGKLA